MTVKGNCDSGVVPEPEGKKKVSRILQGQWAKFEWICGLRSSYIYVNFFIQMVARDYVGQHPYYFFFRKYTLKYLDLNRIYVTYSEKICMRICIAIYIQREWGRTMKQIW